MSGTEKPEIPEFNPDEYIYLDHAATTPTDPSVVEVMLPYFGQYFANASSVHTPGKYNRYVIEKCRETVAGLLDARPEEIIFTGGGTESDNIAILGTAYKLKNRGTHVITSEIEHPAVRNCFKKLRVDGFEVTYIPVNRDGIIDLDVLKESIGKDTVLISIMYVNNEIGTIQPIKEIAEITRKNNIIFHTDAVQALGKIPINVAELGVDLLSASAHKIYGPKGVGLLYLRGGGVHPELGRYITPILFGGGHEFGLRPSTENIPGIVGLTEAVKLAYRDMEREMERLRKLRDDFIDWVLENIPGSHLNGDRKRRVAININLRFDGINGRELLDELNKRKICVSTGSACSSKSKTASYVLTAMGLSFAEAFGSIRITMGKSTDAAKMEYVKKALKESVEYLRGGK